MTHLEILHQIQS